MTYTDIAMNLTALNNITAPVINISTDASQVFGQLIDVANTSTNNLLGMFVMLSVFIIVYLTLSDKSPLGDFGYGDARALCIGFGIALLIGLTELASGITNNYLSIGTFTMLFMINVIFILAYENKE